MKTLSNFQKMVATAALLRTYQQIQHELNEREHPKGIPGNEFCAKSTSVLKHEQEILLTVIETLQDYT